MNRKPLWAAVIKLLLAVILPAGVAAQTLNLTNGVQTYTTLSNTIVTLTGHCELRITGTNSPISGSTINLNSADAWFILSNLRPSVVSASYLSQVLVNGSAAVAGSNCRLEEFAMGAVIIPQSPSYTPLTVFNRQNFLGASTNFGIYTYYNTAAALGGMYNNIGSFKLKRGYMATFAQNADGTGTSQVFVAQDGDLEIGVMATNLDGQCSFVRVFPWRYTGKKGWGGGDGATEIAMPLWWYDWGNGATSTADREYVPIKFKSSSGTSSINNQHNSAHVLGYNEPDSSAQANMTVAQAIADWPSMMQWGLRVGAPAVSDSGVTGAGLDWLYAFMSQATNLGYRVDFIPVHYYKCGWSTAQFSNYLAGIYQTTGKPVWVTEWNNGASWCSSGLPASQAADATAISSDVAMLESAPFVERYAVYQWFDPSTYLNLITTNATPTLTPAGVVYANQPSALAYTQTLPPGGSHSIAQFEFETNTLDSSGYGNNAFARGIPGYATGHSGQAVVLDGTNSYLQLPPNVANNASFTFAAWVYWNGGAQWQRIFDFGDDTTHYLFLSPYSGGSTLRFAINNGSGEQQLNAPALPVSTWIHVAVTLSGSNAKLYTNGVLAASSTTNTIVPSNFNPGLNYLGKSQFSADPLFHGMLDEVEIADSAFTAAQIAALLTNAPPQFTTNTLWLTATQNVAYSNNISGMVTDTNSGNTLTFSKTGGANWLTISTNGILSGTPGYNDAGTNFITVRVTDPAGASAFAVVNLVLPNIFGNGVWNTDASGNWSDTNKWSGGFPANGAGNTADFSTLNLTANRTVTLEAPRSIGTLKFGDTTGTQTWLLTASNNSVLTLDPGSGSSPAIAVNQNTATIAAPLAGTDGFTKSGAGTLILATNNSFSGTLNVDTAQASSGNDGVLKIAAAGGLGNLTAINIQNQNSASSSLQLDGTAGSIVASAPIALNGRNSATTAIDNVAGTNTLSGNLAINVGGANYWIQSDAGLLTLGGTISAAATGSRTFTFLGPGNTTISGVLADGNGTVNATKTGTGTLTFLGANTYSGITTISSGALQIGNGGSTGALGTNNVTDNAALIFNLASAVNAPNAITGTGTVAKLGTGTLTFSNANSYGGGTTLAQGVIQANNNAAFGTGAITSDTGTNTGRFILGSGVTITNALTANSINAGSGLGFLSVADATSATYSGPITFNANPVAGGHFAGPPTSGWLTIAGPVYSGPSNFLVIRFGNMRFAGGGNYSELQIRANTTSLGANNGLATNAAVDLAGNGNTTAPTVLDLNGFNQTLGGLKNTVTPANVAWVTNSSTTPTLLTLNAGTNNFSFGGSLGGPVSLALNSGTQTLTKSGTSMLNGLYTYSGNTTLNAGTLVLGSGIALPNTPAITVGSGAIFDFSSSGFTIASNQILTGNGILVGNLTNSGTLIPGSGFGGILTCSNNVTLLSASTNCFGLKKSAGTNSQLRVSGILTCAGTLLVTNGAGSLTGGDSFKLFSAGTFAGGFTGFKLPALGTGLAWNTTNLAINGTLSVIATALPQFRSITESNNGTYVFSGTGAAGMTYELDATTNLNFPIAWYFVTNAVASQSGTFQFVDLLATNFSQRFYRIWGNQ